MPVFRRTLAGLSLAMLSTLSHASLERAEQAVAAQDYRAALELLSREGDGVDGRLLQGLALAGMQRYDEAVALYRGLIDELPEQPEAYNNLARLYASQGRLEEARELLEQAMRTHPAYAAVYDNLTRITVEMSRSSYARALRLQGQEEGLQLAALQRASFPPAPTEGGVEPTPTVAAGTDETPPAAATEVVAVAPTAAMVETQPTTEPEVASEAVEQGPEEARSEAEIVEIVTEIGPKEEITLLMMEWAAAWSAQDVDGYLAAYSDNFVPTANLSLQQWREQRRQRIKRPESIQVDLDNIEVLIFDARRARVRLEQAYDADHYSDLTRKEFQLVNERGQWRITSERTLEVLAR